MLEAGALFPNVAARSASATIHFVGSAVISWCLSRRVALEDLSNLQGWKNLSFARLLIILIFTDSLAFVMLTGILIHGVGLELSQASCELGILCCIALYTSSKVLIYVFLSEKVWIVWMHISNFNRTPKAVDPAAPAKTRLHRFLERLHTRAYAICFGSIVLYSACLVLLIVYRVAQRSGPDGICHLGLGKYASVPLVSYDVYVTVLLTGMFIWPLWSHKVMSKRLRRVASRTLVASLIALTTSAVNICVLTVLHGRELGWVCLASCGADVMINALVLDFVTESRLKRYVRLISQSRHRAPPPPSECKPGKQESTFALAMVLGPDLEVALGAPMDPSLSVGARSERSWKTIKSKRRPSTIAASEHAQTQVNAHPAAAYLSQHQQQRSQRQQPPPPSIPPNPTTSPSHVDQHDTLSSVIFSRRRSISSEEEIDELAEYDIPPSPLNSPEISRSSTPTPEASASSHTSPLPSSSRMPLPSTTTPIDSSKLPSSSPLVLPQTLSYLDTYQKRIRTIHPSLSSSQVSEATDHERPVEEGSDTDADTDTDADGEEDDGDIDIDIDIARPRKRRAMLTFTEALMEITPSDPAAVFLAGPRRPSNSITAASVSVPPISMSSTTTISMPLPKSSRTQSQSRPGIRKSASSILSGSIPKSKSKSKSKSRRKGSSRGEVNVLQNGNGHGPGLVPLTMPASWDEIELEDFYGGDGIAAILSPAPTGLEEGGEPGPSMSRIRSRAAKSDAEADAEVEAVAGAEVDDDAEGVEELIGIDDSSTLAATSAESGSGKRWRVKGKEKASSAPRPSTRLRQPAVTFAVSPSRPVHHEHSGRGRGRVDDVHAAGGAGGAGGEARRTSGLNLDEGPDKARDEHAHAGAVDLDVTLTPHEEGRGQNRGKRKVAWGLKR